MVTGWRNSLLGVSSPTFSIVWNLAFGLERSCFQTMQELNYRTPGWSWPFGPALSRPVTEGILEVTFSHTHSHVPNWLSYWVHKWKFLTHVASTVSVSDQIRNNFIVFKNRNDFLLREGLRWLLWSQTGGRDDGCFLERSGTSAFSYNTGMTVKNGSKHRQTLKTQYFWIPCE